MSDGDSIRPHNTDPLCRSAGHFCNVATVFHGPEFFVLDFRALAPDGETPLLARLYLTPGHLKRLRDALDEDLGTFEREFGAVDGRPAQPAAAGPAN